MISTGWFLRLNVHACCAAVLLAAGRRVAYVAVEMLENGLASPFTNGGTVLDCSDVAINLLATL